MAIGLQSPATALTVWTACFLSSLQVAPVCDPWTEPGNDVTTEKHILICGGINSKRRQQLACLAHMLLGCEPRRQQVIKALRRVAYSTLLAKSCLEQRFMALGKPLRISF